MFTYMRTTYGYDPVKNRNLIKRNLKKLIDEKKVRQIKGRGMSGSFKLGHKYRGTLEKLPGASKLVRMNDVFNL